MARGDTKRQQNSGPLQAADDIIRLLANSVTMGGADWLEGAGAPARTKAAQTRAGAAGDVASALGVLGFGGGLLQGGKAAVRAVRAAPKASLGTVAKLGALPALAYAMNQMRTGSGGAGPPAAEEAAVAPVTPVAAAAVREDTIATPFRKWLADLGPAAGKLSLDDLASLSGSFNNMVPASAKTPTKPADIAGLKYLQAIEEERDKAIVRAQQARDPQAEIDADSVAMQRIAQFFGKGLSVPGLEERE